MRFDEVQLATTDQWLEHSEAWRYAHLDLAPSDVLRRLAIQEHNRLSEPVVTVDRHGSHRWRGVLSRTRRRS